MDELHNKVDSRDIANTIYNASAACDTALVLRLSTLALEAVLRLRIAIASKVLISTVTTLALRKIAAVATFALMAEAAVVTLTAVITLALMVETAAVVTLEVMAGVVTLALINILHPSDVTLALYVIAVVVTLAKKEITAVVTFTGGLPYLGSYSDNSHPCRCCHPFHRSYSESGLLSNVITLSVIFTFALIASLRKWHCTLATEITHDLELIATGITFALRATLLKQHAPFALELFMSTDILLWCRTQRVSGQRYHRKGFATLEILLLLILLWRHAAMAWELSCICSHCSNGTS